MKTNTMQSHTQKGKNAFQVDRQTFSFRSFSQLWGFTYNKQT